MFTGIVQEIGTVTSIRRAGGIARLEFHAPKTAAGLGAGESVAVSGVCLTVVRAGRGSVSFEAIPETLRLTNLGGLKTGSRVNLERSLRLSDRLNGHVVLGHVDGVGVVSRRSRQAGQLRLEIRVPREVTPYLVPKGPITVDGVSLTLGERVSGAGACVYLIPETLERTTLGERQTGERVNLEVDYLAKLVRQWMARRSG